MAQATPNIHQFDHHPKRHTTVCRMSLAQHMTGATMTEAMRLARGMVKNELKRERIRLADVEAREITSRAKDYIEAHPELIDDAACTIREWFARGVFGKRAQKEFIKHSTFHCHNVESEQSRLRETQ
jgi:hypothetical protein